MISVFLYKLIVVIFMLLAFIILLYCRNRIKKS